MRKFSESHRRALSESHRGNPKLGGHTLTLDDCKLGGMANKSNLAGQVFGNLMVLREGPRAGRGPTPRPHWWCLCKLCGTEKSISAAALKSGGAVSCGCKKTHAYWVKQGKICSIHGTPKELRKNGDTEKFYCVACGLWNLAKARARVFQLPFSIKKEDIVIPVVCPILGLPLITTPPKSDNTPTLDRIVPSLGYTPDNIHVISFRANRLKQDATALELGAILSYVKQYTPLDNH